jgi:hypothetical protein
VRKWALHGTCGAVLRVVFAEAGRWEGSGGGASEGWVEEVGRAEWLLPSALSLTGPPRARPRGFSRPTSPHSLLPLFAPACGAADVWVQQQVLTAKKALHTWGLNNFGQLGLGDHTNRLRPEEVTQLRVASLSFIVSGGFHNVGVSAQGVVFVWGQGHRGQLGVGTEAPRSLPRPTAVEALRGTKIVRAAAGLAHTFFLSDRRRLYACGDNSSGQLGICSSSSGGGGGDSDSDDEGVKQLSLTPMPCRPRPPVSAAAAAAAAAAAEGGGNAALAQEEDELLLDDVFCGGNSTFFYFTTAEGAAKRGSAGSSDNQKQVR